MSDATSLPETLDADAWASVQMMPGGDVEDTVDVELVHTAMDRIGRGAADLRQLSTEQIADRLGRLHQFLLESPESPLPRMASVVESTTGLSQPMVIWALRDLLKRLTPRALIALVEAEFGHRDPFHGPRMLATHAAARAANPPDRVFYVMAGTIPGVPIEAMVLSLLARAPAVIKTSRAEPATARLYLEAMRRVAPDLARALSVVTWPGGTEELERTACDRASVVVAYGSNETIDAMYQRCRFPTKFIGYGHRVSFGIMAEGDASFGAPALRELARLWALDASAYDQFGCMSLACLFVSTRGPWTPTEVARAIANEGFPYTESFMPRGRLSTDTAAAHVQARAVAEFQGTLFAAPTAAVVLHDQCRFEPTPGGRLLHVVPWTTHDELDRALRPLRGLLSTAGVWCDEQQRSALTGQLSRLGVRRITRPGRMQRPLWLRDHDGRPRISDWVDWTDVEP
jgi:hypothetical protein